MLLDLSSLTGNGPHVPVMALNALDVLGLKAPSIAARLKTAAASELSIPQRVRTYVPRQVEKINAEAMK